MKTSIVVFSDADGGMSKTVVKVLLNVLVTRKEASTKDGVNDEVVPQRPMTFVLHAHTRTRM